MLIQTRNIPSGGLDVDFALPPEVMSAASAQDNELKELFREKVECHVHLEISHKKDVQLNGEAQTSIHPTCARCDEVFDQPFTIDIFVTCAPEPHPRKGPDSYQESQEGLVFYRNNEVNLGEIIREQILLALPIRYLCKETCRGLCDRCGANLNLGEHHCKTNSKESNHAST